MNQRIPPPSTPRIPLHLRSLSPSALPIHQTSLSVGTAAESGNKFRYLPRFAEGRIRIPVCASQAILTVPSAFSTGDYKTTMQCTSFRSTECLAD